MTASLKTQFGHEENLSQAIANSKQLSAILGQFEVTLSGAPSFEQKVAKGHDGHNGRIDILFPSTKGQVIVEVQYGAADKYHAARLQNYAQSVANTALVVWVAESFSKAQLNAFKTAKHPVVCVLIKAATVGFTLKTLTAKTNVLPSQARRLNNNRKRLAALLAKHSNLFKVPENFWGSRFDGFIGNWAAGGMNLIAGEPKNAARAFYKTGRSSDFITSHPDMAEVIEDIADEVAGMQMLTAFSVSLGDEFTDNLARVQLSGIDEDAYGEAQHSLSTRFTQIRRQVVSFNQEHGTEGMGAFLATMAA